MAPQPYTPSQSTSQLSQSSHLRIFTSYSQQIPADLSYQNIKLNNFIELQLAQLNHSLQNINQRHFRNQLKQCITKSGSIFHEMQKLYGDLNVGFLYAQVKKLMHVYQVIFVEMVEEGGYLDTKNMDVKNSLGNQRSVKKQERKSYDQGKRGRVNNNQKLRNKGISLYNQSYIRNIDYSSKQIFQLRKKVKQMKQNPEKQKRRQLEMDILDQINQMTTRQPDSCERYLLNRQKSINQVSKTANLGEQLQNIVTFLRVSQNQALDFLKKNYSSDSFYELTEGFNNIMQNYRNSKEMQISVFQQKIKQLMQKTKVINLKLQTEILNLKKQILRLKQEMKKKQVKSATVSCQTYYSFDQQIKNLQQKIEQNQIVKTNLIKHIESLNQNIQKNKQIIVFDTIQKQTSRNYSKTNRQSPSDNKTQFPKIDIKTCGTAQIPKYEQIIQNPIYFFNSLEQQVQQKFIEQLKQQGWLSLKTQFQQYQIAMKSKRLRTPQKTIRNEFYGEDLVGKNWDDIQKESQKEKQIKRRESRRAEISNRQNMEVRVHLLRSGMKNTGNNYQTEQNKRNSESYSQKTETPLKGNKMIKRKTSQKQKQEQLKARVFDIQQKNGFDYVQRKSQQVETKSKNQSNFSSQFNQKAVRVKTEQTQQDNQDGPYHYENFSQQNVTQNENLSSHENNFQNSRVTTEPNETTSEKEKQQSEKKYKQVSIRQNYRQKGIKTLIQKITKVENQVIKQKSKQAQETVRKDKIDKIDKNTIQQNKDTKDKLVKKEQKTVKNINSINKRKQKQKQSYQDINNQFNGSKGFVEKQQQRQKNSFNQKQTDNMKNKKKYRLNSFKNEQKNHISMKNSLIEENSKQISSQMVSNNSEQTLIRKYKKDFKSSILKYSQKLSLIAKTQEQKPVQFQKSANSIVNQTKKIYQSSFYDEKFTKTILCSQQQFQIKKQNINQQFKQSTLIRKLEQQFGDSKILQASRQCQTAEQFAMKVKQLHKLTCGNYCKHIERYLQIFNKLKKELNKREAVKIHVQNVGNILSGLGKPLPQIKK